MKRLLVLLLIPASVLAVAGAVAAWWLVSGNGTASALSGDVVPVEVALAEVPASLYPGRTQAVRLEITNDNDFAVVVTGLPASSSTATSSCPAGNVTTAALSDGAGLLQVDGSTRSIPAGGSGTYDVVATMALADGADTSGCAGAALSLPVTAVAVSAP